ncbi:type II toxin-antitoxin system HicB family antitoxin [Patescibacteria group bacterium]|nr:type II toxin-antitoxin system HicB family antitoxin [Patescibacteria group bacterium]
MKFSYPYTMQPQDDGGYFVQFVDLEEAFTEGETVEEAAFNAAEVLTGVLSYRIEKGDEIPAPSPAGDMLVATPSASVQAAILLRDARGEKSLSDMARALETSWAAAQRLEDPRHWPTLKQLDRAAKLLGKRLVLALD